MTNSINNFSALHLLIDGVAQRVLVFNRLFGPHSQEFIDGIYRRRVAFGKALDGYARGADEPSVERALKAQLREILVVYYYLLARFTAGLGRRFNADRDEMLLYGNVAAVNTIKSDITSISNRLLSNRQIEVDDVHGGQWRQIVDQFHDLFEKCQAVYIAISAPLERIELEKRKERLTAHKLVVAIGFVSFLFCMLLFYVFFPRRAFWTPILQWYGIFLICMCLIMFYYVFSIWTQRSFFREGYAAIKRWL